MAGYDGDAAQYITASMDISGANAVYQIFPRAFRLMQIRIYAATVTATADETITASKQKIIQSSSGAVSIGTFPVVSTLVAGDQVRVSLATIDPAKCEFNAGEELKLLCGNSTGTGTVYFGLIGYHFSEGPNPQSSFSSTAKSISGTGTIKYAAFTAA
jgi:hypothetical protein